LAVTLADTFTAAKKKQIYYSDFTDNFDSTPFVQCLARITNEQDVTQSLKNLIFTNLGERFFQPAVGCNITASLFELSGPILQNELQNAITTTITNFEPRAVLQSLIIQNPDSTVQLTAPADIDKNSITVTVQYYLVNTPNLITFTVFLQKLR
jgi:phage baseplate assembly protein W